MSEVDRRIQTAFRRAVGQRNYRRVRDRALARLRQLHPDQYLELLEEERVRDEQESKAWLDITGRTNANVGTPTTNTESSQTTEGSSDRAAEGELG